MDYILSVVNKTNEILWGKNIVVIVLIFSAIYFTIATKFVQFRVLGKSLKHLAKEKTEETGISSIESLFLSTACRVGAGNIAGVVAAISFGGAGSIFWMWLVAIFGAATAFVEATLAVIYREKYANTYIGGTPYIYRNAHKLPFLGLIYAIASLICYLGVIQVMSNSITGSIVSVYSIKDYDLAKIISIGLVIMLVYILFLNKSKKDSIVAVLNKMVPIMAVIYISIVIFVLIANITSVPAMFVNIVKQAFGGKEFLGGMIGSTIMYGVQRGLFSNEAGSGNCTYAAAATNNTYAAKQGMVQILGVFLDTLIICSSTAFVILLAPETTSKITGMELFQKAMSHHIGSIGHPLGVVMMFFFSMSTILAVIYYGNVAISYISKKTYSITIFQIITIIMVYIGGIKQDLFVWSLADFGLGIMTITNVICIIPLTRKALDALKEYEDSLGGK